MATPNAGIPCSPLSLKPCCCLLSWASPHHTRRLQQESSTTAEGMRLQKVEQGNLISNWRKAGLHSQKPHCVHILCRSWNQTEDEVLCCPTTANISRTIYKRSDWRLEQQHALQHPEGNFPNSVAAFHSLSDSSRRSQGENRGIRPLLVVGLGMPCVLGGVYLVGLVDFYLGFVLVFWKKIRDGAGSYLGRGTEGSLGHTCSSYGDKRIFFEVGLLLWVLLETTLAAEHCSFVRLSLLRMLDYLWLSQFLSHKVDFLSASKRTTGSLTLHYPVYERKQEYKVHTINHPEKYHNSSQMFCQAKKPNTGILQEKKTTFCYRLTHFTTENWIPCFLFCMYGTARGFRKETTYLKQPIKW